MGKNNRNYLAAYILALSLLPIIVTNNYHVMVLNVAFLNIIVVVGLNLLMGYAGQVSLGHAAFFGMGAYLSAILSKSCGLPAWPSMLLAIMMTGLIAYGIGLPTLRLEGHYLVMATLGFNIIVHVVMVQLDKVTGGPSGFSGIPRLSIGGFVFNSDLKVYLLFAAVSIGVLILSLNLVHSRAGLALAALSENEVAARCAGIDTGAYKIRVFVVSAILASLAGGLYAHYITFISPGSFSFFYSLQIVTMVLVGGIGSVWGSVVGSAFLTILPEILHAVKEYNVLVYGLLLMVVLLFFPRGLFPGIAKALGRRTRRVRLIPSGGIG